MTDRILGYGIRKGKLYYLEEEASVKANNTEGRNSLPWLWHRRLGHFSFGYLKKLKPELFLSNKPFDTSCDVCEMAKSHRVSYYPSENKTTFPLMKIHSHIQGPTKIATPCGYCFFVTFIDEFSRMIWISLLKHKSDVHMLLMNFTYTLKLNTKVRLKSSNPIIEENMSIMT